MKLKLVLSALVLSMGLYILHRPVNGDAVVYNFAGKKINIVLLGDSYSAGNGADGREYGPAGCHRNRFNWAERYKSWLRNNGLSVTLHNRACSGAKTEDFTEPKKLDSRLAYARINATGFSDDGKVRGYFKTKNVCGQPDNDEVRLTQRVRSINRSREGTISVSLACDHLVRPQVENVDKSTDLVLMTIGGNDIGFNEIVRECFTAGVREFTIFRGCKGKIEEARSLMSDLSKNTKALLDSLRSRLRPDAKIALLGYPLLALDSNVKHFGYPIASEVRKLGLEGNRRQKQMVADYNKSIGTNQVIFIDNIPTYFAGHEPDADWKRKNPNRWINEFFEPSLTDNSGWYHPNSLGHSAYATKLREALPMPSLVQPIAKKGGDIDIVFVLDSTGSMFHFVNSAKSNIRNITETISYQVRSARFAMVTYQDHPDHGGSPNDYPYRIESDFTSDEDTFASVVNRVELGNGGDGPESVYSGIRAGLSLKWRAGVKKVVIVIGDAPPKDPEPVTGLTSEDIIDLAFAVDPAQVSFIDVGFMSYRHEEGGRAISSVASRTGGSYYSSVSGRMPDLILKAFSDIDRKPYAWLNGPYIAKVGDTVELDASGSYSANGQIVKYEWDLDADGSYDKTTTDSVLNYKFNDEVSGLMAVRITDSTGQVNVANTQLVISDDGDEFPREIDNCPDIANQSQADYDEDGVGDACDEDPGFLDQYRAFDADVELSRDTMANPIRYVTPLDKPAPRSVVATYESFGGSQAGPGQSINQLRPKEVEQSRSSLAGKKPELSDQNNNQRDVDRSDWRWLLAGGGAILALGVSWTVFRRIYAKKLL